MKIEESVKEKKSIVVEENGVFFQINYLPKAAMNRLETWIEKIEQGLAVGEEPESAADFHHGSISEEEIIRIPAEEAAEKYTDFLKVCVLYTHDDMMKSVLDSAAKKKDGTLIGRRVQHITFAGVSIEREYYELCAVNETPTVITIEIRKTECRHKNLDQLAGKPSCKEILAKMGE